MNKKTKKEEPEFIYDNSKKPKEQDWFALMNHHAKKIGTDEKK